MSFPPFDPSPSDVLVLRSLATSYPLTSSAWPASSPPSDQPVILHARIYPPAKQGLRPGEEGRFDTSAALDELDDSTLSYALVADAFLNHLASHARAIEGQRYDDPEQLAEGLAKVALEACRASRIDLAIELPSSLLHAESFTVIISRSPAVPERALESGRADRLVITDLRVDCIIGVLSFERDVPQPVILNLVLWPTSRSSSFDDMELGIGASRLSKLLHSHVARSSFRTVEALASSVAALCLSLPPASPGPDKGAYAVGKVNVRVEKPKAVTWAQGAGVEITRTRGRWMDLVDLSGSTQDLAGPLQSLPPSRSSTAFSPPSSSRATLGSSHRHFSSAASSSYTAVDDPSSSTGHHVVFLGLGSNLGSRLANLDRALSELVKPVGEGEEGGAGAKVLDVSFAYETEPMFVEDQPRFLNAVCKISTPLDPLPLLDALKSIEARLGRDLTAARQRPKGPRPIDLDILFYDGDQVHEPRLRVPHIGMLEREFVLRPLADIAPGLRHPVERETVAALLARLTTSDPSDVMIHPLVRSVPIPSTTLVAPELDLSTRTHIMGIVNCTPDSFSDGGDAFDTDAAVRAVLKHVEDGADIVDLGGMSTRPGAEDVSPEEEIRRTVPVIEKLRKEQGVSCHISIDTFRADVARAAVEAGATMVNDVTGGRGDPLMLETVADLGVPYVLMHMRGTPKTMSKLVDYDGDVIGGVRKELSERVGEALQAGIRRWNIILDPGIGFAKNIKGNLTLLRDLRKLLRPDPLFATSTPGSTALEGFPLLVGASRKRFLGELAEVPDPKERDWATAATTVAAVEGGAHIVRVHNTAATRDVVKVADAMYRRRSVESSKK